MKIAISPARWVKSTLVSLMGLAIVFGVGLSAALAVPAAPANQELEAQALPIQPELTNPGEIPLEEFQAPPQISAIDWFEELVATAEAIEPEGNSLDSMLDQWLSTAKTIFNGS